MDGQGLRAIWKAILKKFAGRAEVSEALSGKADTTAVSRIHYLTTAANKITHAAMAADAQAGIDAQAAYLEVAAVSDTSHRQYVGVTFEDGDRFMDGTNLRVELHMAAYEGECYLLLRNKGASDATLLLTVVNDNGTLCHMAMTEEGIALPAGKTVEVSVARAPGIYTIGGTNRRLAVVTASEPLMEREATDTATN